MGKLIIDDKSVSFTKSKCKCEFCLDMNNPSFFKVKDNVGKRLLAVIKNIEKREKIKKYQKNQSTELIH
jgi:hypothetical protein